MSVKDWFKRLTGATGNSANPEIPKDDRGAEVGGLNFKSAVDAHMRWKVRLEGYINGTNQEDLKVDVVCRDDQCPLGKWIYGQGGQQFGFSETFYEMKVHHAHFHTCAGGVLQAAQAGDKDKAMGLLHHGDYLRASERVKMLLARLFVLVADGKAAIDAHIKWKERLHDYVSGAGGEELKADLVAREQRIRTRAGTEHLLQVWVKRGDLGKTEFAMKSLIASVVWDEARFGLADVGDVDADLVGNAVDVEQVAAIAGDHGVGERDVRSVGQQRDREIAADETEAAGDEDVFTVKTSHAVVHTLSAPMWDAGTIGFSGSRIREWRRSRDRPVHR